ncbi:MAG: hypothetical protein IJS68_00010 [Clostridia bacterium]|nr:hypothetical protein [Clostridia bacterium]
MKILVLTMTCGNGHNAVANALEESFLSRGISCKVCNIFQSNKRLEALNNDAYSFACSKIPHLYDFVWNKQRKRNPEKRYTGLGTYFIKRALIPNANEINTYAPDVIICTHVYASNIVCNLKRNHKINESIPTYTFLLDYCVCPYFEDSILVDGVFTPSEITHPELISRGYNEKQLHAFGYPVNNKYYAEFDKTALRNKLNIPQDAMVALSLNGGNGIGKAEKLISILNKSQIPNLYIINVCGKNQKLKNKIDRLVKKENYQNVLNMGFSKNIEELMASSDILFTRAGSTFLSEAVQMNLVPIIRERTQANETLNKKLFLKQNICYEMKKLSDAPKVIKAILNSPEDLATKKQNLKSFNKPYGLNKVIEYILKANKQ